MLVLILILLEYGLRRYANLPVNPLTCVLILILLEYGLRPSTLHPTTSMCTCLNPYSTGIWSATRAWSAKLDELKSLNPYSTGIWSATRQCGAMVAAHGVLILILLEYGLRQNGDKNISYSSFIVLILILLEYGLRLLTAKTLKEDILGLNPYSTGIWSATPLILPYQFEEG